MSAVNPLNPLAVFIIPAYNTGEYIADCLKSIHAQTYSSFICIIVDDGSTDNTSFAVNHFINETSDDRFIYRHKENGGVSCARNYGLDQISALGIYPEFVIFADSDDLLHPKFLELIITSMLKFNAELGLCGVREFVSTSEVPNSNTSIAIAEVKCISGREKILKHFEKDVREDGTAFAGLCNKIFRYSKISDLRFNIQLTVCEDQLFIFDYLCRINTAAIINSNCYFYRLRSDSASHSCTMEKHLSGIEAFSIVINGNYFDELKDYAKRQLFICLYYAWEFSCTSRSSSKKEIFLRLRKHFIRNKAFCPNFLIRKVRRCRYGYMLNLAYMQSRNGFRRYKKIIPSDKGN